MIYENWYKSGNFEKGSKTVPSVPFQKAFDFSVNIPNITTLKRHCFKIGVRTLLKNGSRKTSKNVKTTWQILNFSNKSKAVSNSTTDFQNHYPFTCHNNMGTSNRDKISFGPG